MDQIKSQDHWDRVSDLFHQALALPPDEVEPFCRNACGADLELLQLLRELLANAEGSDDRILESIADLANEATSDDSLTGTRVGAYYVDSLIARGGMGAVYLASRADGEFEKKVAVKVVSGSLPEEATTQLFRNERQALANLNHLSIPTLVDSGQLDDGRSYFICDYIEGDTIDDHCRNEKLSISARLELFRGVGEAVQHAHNNLILHLDIKPSNVLVQPIGIPSLLDFGVARLVGEIADGYRAFSPGYASPEQVRGDNLTAASDVYSLGALLYNLLSGKAPFSIESQAPSETVLLKRAEFVERLEHMDDLRDVNEDLCAIIRKAMSELPTDRYSTVDSLLNDLKRYQNNLPVTARQSTFGYRLGKYLRRNRIAVGTSLLIMATLAGFGLRENHLRQEAQAASEATTQVSDFLLGIFDVMDPSESRGNTVTARELLDKAAANVVDDLATQPEVARRVMHTMSKTYSGLGLYQQATSIMKNAVDLSKQSPNKRIGAEQNSQLLTDLGAQYVSARRYEEAGDILERNVVETERALGTKHPDYVMALSTLATLRTQTQSFDVALPLHLKAVEIAEQVLSPNAPQLARVLSNLDGYYSTLGELRPREDLLKRILSIHESAYTPEHLNVAHAVSNLAMFYVQDMRPAEAIDTLERAHQLALKSLKPDHPAIGTHLERLGVTHRNLGQFEQAENYLLKALRVQEKSLGMSHPTVGETCSVLGSLYNSMGRTDDALVYLNRSLNIMREYHPENHANVAYQKLALGEVYRVDGSLTDAERYTFEAVQTLFAIEESAFLERDGEWQLANVFRDQGRYDAAEPIYSRLFAWHSANPSPDEEHMLEVAEDYRRLLKLMGREEEASTIVTPSR